MNAFVGFPRELEDCQNFILSERSLSFEWSLCQNGLMYSFLIFVVACLWSRQIISLLKTYAFSEIIAALTKCKTVDFLKGSCGDHWLNWYGMTHNKMDVDKSKKISLHSLHYQSYNTSLETRKFINTARIDASKQPRLHQFELCSDIFSRYLTEFIVPCVVYCFAPP